MDGAHRLSPGRRRETSQLRRFGEDLSTRPTIRTDDLSGEESAHREEAERRRGLVLVPLSVGTFDSAAAAERFASSLPAATSFINICRLCLPQLSIWSKLLMFTD
ncbi:hypothetical protein JOB18_049149 [Solea senegalensis]|uniref:Uncharacterized protein n=1 Tax=Solea senegalensis TaxID=28829 RepID=A0AAV6RR12_SOLSE|nr:hypothetical protein JOB18_049149 [Solea senegalensis]